MWGLGCLIWETFNKKSLEQQSNLKTTDQVISSILIKMTIKLLTY